MASGVKVNAECTEAFNKVKSGQKPRPRFVVFKLSDDLKEVVVDMISEIGQTYDELKKYLMEVGELRDCRYAVYDCHFEHGGSTKEKLIFIAWAPENAVIKKKMVYTSSKDYIKKALKMTQELQATDNEELGHEYVIEKLARTMKD